MAITKEEILEKMREKNVVILDVLPKEDYDKLHIKGSQSLSIVHLRPEEFVKAVETNYGRENLFITYCSGFPCRHFMEAAEALSKMGFKAEGYPGGIQEWAESGLPVEGTQAVLS